MEDQEEMDQIEAAYHEGYLAGLAAYAHWKDGAQYVGVMGRTLKEAKEQAKKSWNYMPPRLFK